MATGLAELCRLDPDLARLVAAGMRPPLRRREPGLAGLLSIVVGQQVSTASARAILARLAAAFPDLSAARIAAASDAELLGAGLSRPKLRTLRAISASILAGRLDLSSLAGMPAAEAHAALTAVPGIGPWTADIYLLFCLGHPDVFPAGDLALQEAVRALLGLPARPNAKALAAIAERWRPWRGVAAGLLWAHYRRIKSREGVLAL
ncbi:DNA-3-methyladenine glycosylase family protein [Enterovirga aerilata]|nr:DNA-3-methyladenine glycosylase 2 family protein [Enterovirga sp. DB1703]